MSAVVWSTGPIDGGLGWFGDKDVVDIDEYNTMLEGTVLGCRGEIVFVMARLGLRRIHVASEENGMN